MKSRKFQSRLVVKFGGSSLANGERISRAVNMIVEGVRRGSRIAVVVSAMGKTTDHLLQTAKETAEGLSNSMNLDDILSMGERTSARIFSAALAAKGVDSRYFDPTDSDWPIITDNVHGNATPLLDDCNRRIAESVLPLVEKGNVPIIPGFVGTTREGRISTIGRGGSDTTAFILARAMRADEVVLVTDVAGIMSADPKLVKRPHVLKEIDADVLARLADSGAKFIHKKALKFKDRDINVRVISNLSKGLNAKGTLVKGLFPAELTVSLSYPEPVSMLTIVGRGVSEETGLLNDISQRIRNSRVPLLGMSGNYDSLILYVPERSPSRMFESIHSIVTSRSETLAVALRRNLAYLKVRGVGLEETPGLIGEISEPLRSSGINIFGIFTIASSILVFVDWADCRRAMESISQALRRTYGNSR